MSQKLSVWALALAVMFGLSGCGGGGGGEFREFNPNSDKSHDAEHGPHHAEHAHGHGHGPHDGELIELGEEEYHAEVVFDEDTDKTTLYFLAADAKTAVAIEAKEIVLELPGKDASEKHTLAAAPQDGDLEGKSSRFEITSEELIETFHQTEGLTGTFKVSIGGKEFTGKVQHAHHDEAPKATPPK